MTTAADIAWILASSGLVLLMIPGLAFFYMGAADHVKNAGRSLFVVFAVFALVTVSWGVCGYSLAFGDSWHGIVGTSRLELDSSFQVFQGLFAAVTTALVAGSLIERVRMRYALAFCLVWFFVVYVPIAHWVWADDGWLKSLGAIDFAGGTVVHISSGVTALIVAMVLGERKQYWPNPDGHVWIALGGTLLLFGWLGFNAGSSLHADHAAVKAFVNTILAASAGGCMWMLAHAIASKWIKRQEPVSEITNGMLAGLVAITPAAGIVDPLFAIGMGMAVVPMCYVMPWVLGSTDDAFDLFRVHGTAGIMGALMTGLMADEVGGIGQVWIQLVAVVAVSVYAALVTYALTFALRRVRGVSL